MIRFNMKSILLPLLFFVSAAQAGEIKNSQDLLGGLLTRAGNSKQQQLNDQQLKMLCEQGYTNAYFLYDGATARTVSCSKGTIKYSSQGTKNVKPIIANIYDGVKSGHRTFVHCHNGAHASGIVAAMALREFCDYSGDKAFNYWVQKAKTNPLPEKNVGIIRGRLMNYQPFGFDISASDKAALCK